MAVLTCGVLLAQAYVSFGSSKCYAVSINGENIGTTSSKEDAQNAIIKAEQTVYEVLGVENSFSDASVVEVSFGKAENDTQELTEEMLKTVDGIKKMYAVTVNGVMLGASEEADALYRILDEILSGYETENTVSAFFVQRVSVEETYVSEDITTDLNEIKKQLSIDSGSPNALSVKTLEVVGTVEEISFGVTYMYDDTSYETESKVLFEGESGEMSVNYVVTKLNGITITKKERSSEVIKEAENKIISVGTMEGSPTDSKGYYIWPTDGVISSYFGNRSVEIGSSNHGGLDIAGTNNQSIYAADGGKVIFSGWATGYGNIIKIQHDNGDITCYAHLNESLVKEGQMVCQGERIGLMGSTGTSSGPHLHFEVRLGGTTKVNPLKYLP